MSLDHRIYIGIFDEEALQRGALAVSHPLDWERLAALFRDHGEVSSHKTAEVGGHTFKFHEEGFLSCSAVIGRQDVVDLIYRLAAEFGCRIANLEMYSSESPEQFRSGYEQLLNWRKFRRSKSQRQGH